VGSAGRGIDPEGDGRERRTARVRRIAHRLVALPRDAQQPASAGTSGRPTDRLETEHNVNKQQLIDAAADSAELSKNDVSKALDAVLDTITDALKAGDRVALTGFGTFEVRDRAARTARNPQTGESIQVAASRAPAFKAGKALKDAVN
jgi:DNA-binding protein HU-beta